MAGIPGVYFQRGRLNMTCISWNRMVAFGHFCWENEKCEKLWCLARINSSERGHSAAGRHEIKKILKDFRWCDKNGLNESFKMSPHLICLSWHLKSLLWPASVSGLDVIWKLIPHLRHVRWGLILKLSLRPFLLHHPESLRILVHLMSPCRAVRWSRKWLWMMLCYFRTFYVSGAGGAVW